MKRIFTTAVYIFLGSWLCAAEAIGTENRGRYEGTIQVEFMPDGVTLKLLREFKYIDPNGMDWIAPAGAIVDGASIPQWAWSFFGSPLTGKYRDASVIHDVACEEKARTWEVVHLAFYYALLSSGVDETTADIMYGAVYWSGPRWSLSIENPANEVSIRPTSLCVGSACYQFGSESSVVKTAEGFMIEATETTVTGDQLNALAAEISRRRSQGNPMSLDEITAFTFPE